MRRKKSPRPTKPRTQTKNEVKKSTMTKFIEVSGKTEEEAVAAGLAQLGLTRDEVSLEYMELPKKGFLGFGGSPAVIRISYEAPDEPETPAPAPEAPKAAPAEPKPAKKPEAPKAPAAPVKPEKPDADAPLEQRVECYLRGLLDLMGVKADITLTPREGGGVNAELSGSGMGTVIGRRGETLDAIQHLVNYSVNRGSDKRLHINVDAENYRSKREESLVHLAEKMAAKAVKYKRSMALEPMNSYERHVIHTALQNYEGVSTSSIGVEPNRRVVVSYEKTENRDNRPQSREWA